MKCPFCGVADYDAFGLKVHLLDGDCDPFTQLDIPPKLFSSAAAQPNDWNPQEALFAFMGWLTSRRARVTFSASDDASPACDLIRDFSLRHKLSGCREGWDKRIVHEAPDTGGLSFDLLQRVSDVVAQAAPTFDDLKRCPKCRSADIVVWVSTHRPYTKWRCEACDHRFMEPWVASGAGRNHQ